MGHLKGRCCSLYYPKCIDSEVYDRTVTIINIPVSMCTSTSSPDPEPSVHSAHACADLTVCPDRHVESQCQYYSMHGGIPDYSTRRGTVRENLDAKWEPSPDTRVLYLNHGLNLHAMWLAHSCIHGHTCASSSHTTRLNCHVRRASHEGGEMQGRCTRSCARACAGLVAGCA